MIEIKNWKTGEVIHSGNFASVKDCVEDAVRKRISLAFVDLCEANLRWANLCEANLRWADLFGADLFGADLRWADLGWADLRWANLLGAKGLLSWQAPTGEKRICYSVSHSNDVMHKLGYRWGNTQSTVNAIRKKYGENSMYERYVWLAHHSLMQEGE